MQLKQNIVLKEMDDSEELPGLAHGVERLNEPALAELRFNLQRKPRRTKSGKIRTGRIAAIGSIYMAVAFETAAQKFFLLYR